MKYKLEIKSEQYYNNGNLMLRFLEDGKQEALEEKIREWLRCDCELTAKSRKNKQSGINANELNKALRNNLCMKNIILRKLEIILLESADAITEKND